jgi:hypothetical protein
MKEREREREREREKTPPLSLAFSPRVKNHRVRLDAKLSTATCVAASCIDVSAAVAAVVQYIWKKQLLLHWKQLVAVVVVAELLPEAVVDVEKARPSMHSLHHKFDGK